MTAVNTTDSFGSNKAKRAQQRILEENNAGVAPLLEPDFPWLVIAPPASFFKGLAYLPDAAGVKANGYEGS